MTEHTPGPWQLVTAGDGPTKQVVADENCCSLLTIVEECGVKFAAIYEEADGRLIASAPDLLESLVDLVALYPLDSTDAIITSARAAIAKATGGAE